MKQNNPAAPICHECKWRREIPGNCHSSCHCPQVTEIWANPLAALIAVTGGVPPLMQGIVEGHKHGIRMGWFSWPVNFDPVWLETCDAFEPESKQ